MRSKTGLLAVVVVAVLALVGIAGCGGNDTPATTGTAPGTDTGVTETTAGTETTTGATTGPGGTGTTGSVDAKQVFTANCSSCHGAQGDGGPVNVNLQQRGPTLPESRIEAQIRNGGGGMPSFQGRLSDAEIAALTAYVKAGVSAK